MYLSANTSFRHPERCRQRLFVLQGTLQDEIFVAKTALLVLNLKMRSLHLYEFYKFIIPA
jgi:hypothetical protein